MTNYPYEEVIVMARPARSSPFENSNDTIIDI